MKVVLKSEVLDEVVNLINNLEFTSKSNFQNSMKLVKIYELLSSAEVMKEEEVSNA